MMARQNNNEIGEAFLTIFIQPKTINPPWIFLQKRKSTVKNSNLFTTMAFRALYAETLLHL